MGEKTAVPWCHHTFNPWWGCVERSPGCDNCYARRWATRCGFKVWGLDAPRRFFGDAYWNNPLKWNAKAQAAGERRRVFVGSMCDVMEDRRDLDPARSRLFGLVAQTEWLDWLFLTKLPQNYPRFLPELWLEKPRSNVWGLTTVESQKEVWRIEELSRVNFAVRGVSYEPALGPLDLTGYLCGHDCEDFGLCQINPQPPGKPDCAYPRIDWLIAGGESGPNARPSHPDWVRKARDQCQAAKVSFFFKQWGEFVPGDAMESDGEKPGWCQFQNGDLSPSWNIRLDPTHAAMRVGKKAAGQMVDGRQWHEFPGSVQ